MTAPKQALATVSVIVCMMSLKTAVASEATQGSDTGQPTTTQTKAVSVKNEIRPGTVEELVRIRCATDGSDQWTTWTGRIFSFVPGERQKLLFNVVGANVARCKKNAKDQWYFTSRELMYYLDPKTNKPLKMWENPWTKRSVPVMHVANDLVQGVLRDRPKSISRGQWRACASTSLCSIPMHRARTKASRNTALTPCIKRVNSSLYSPRRRILLILKKHAHP